MHKNLSRFSIVPKQTFSFIAFLFSSIPFIKLLRLLFKLFKVPNTRSSPAFLPIQFKLMEGQRYNLKYKMTNHVHEFQNTQFILALTMDMCNSLECSSNKMQGHWKSNKGKTWNISFPYFTFISQVHQLHPTAYFKIKQNNCLFLSFGLQRALSPTSRFLCSYASAIRLTAVTQGKCTLPHLSLCPNMSLNYSPSPSWDWVMESFIIT